MTSWKKIFDYLEEFKKGFDLPSVSLIGQECPNPYRILISTVISLRTRDEVTLEASRRLFALADCPEEMVRQSLQAIEERIYPCGFFRVKAQNIRTISQILLDQYQGKVPSDLEALLALPGVGLKTANLVRSLGFHIPAICVDTHVHRIANRMGWIKTSKADESVKALEEVLPLEYWIPVNELLVLYGQQVCTPRKPHCDRCGLQSSCPYPSVN